MSVHIAFLYMMRYNLLCISMWFSVHETDGYAGRDPEAIRFSRESESRRRKVCGGLPEHETAEQKKGFCGTLCVPRGGALPLFLKE